MKISDRAEKTQASPIRKLVPLADAAKKAGVRVYHLNIGQPDLPTPKPSIQALKNWKGDVLAYGHSQGQDFLIETLLGYYRSKGLDVDKQDLFITTAGSEAIIFAMTAVADPGDEIIVFEPFYTNYNGFASQASVNLVPITLSVDNGFHLPEPSVIEAKITRKTKAILFCSPNNPTGTVYTKKEMEQLADIVKKHGLFLLSDEVYREFIYDKSVQHTSVLQLEGVADRAVLMDSVSKRFSMCGARIGHLVTKNRDLWNAFLKFGQARLCPPQIEQFAVDAAYKMDPKDYIVPMIDEYRVRRDTVFSHLQNISGVKTFLPEGAFYLMAKLPVDDADSFAGWMLSDFPGVAGLKETVMVAPGSGFYATPGMGKNEVRIAYVLKQQDLERAMELLAKGLELYPGRLG